MKTRNILMICVFSTIINSCMVRGDELSPESFIEHLGDLEYVLNDSTILGWSAECRIDDAYRHYVLQYDTVTTPLYIRSKYGSLRCYINCYDINRGEPIYTNAVDTSLLCNCWGVDVNCYNEYVKSICMSIHKIIDGYYIDEFHMGKNGLCFFSSIKSGWNLIYLKDMTPQDKEVLEEQLGNRYSQIEKTSFWIQKGQGGQIPVSPK